MVIFSNSKPNFVNSDQYLEAELAELEEKYEKKKVQYETMARDVIRFCGGAVILYSLPVMYFENEKQRKYKLAQTLVRM